MARDGGLSKLGVGSRSPPAWSAREIELQALATLAALAQISTPSAALFLKSHQLLVQKFAADRNRQKGRVKWESSNACSARPDLYTVCRSFPKSHQLLVQKFAANRDRQKKAASPSFLVVRHGLPRPDESRFPARLECALQAAGHVSHSSPRVTSQCNTCINVTAHRCSKSSCTDSQSMRAMRRNT
jgi:hypothetical protein